MATQSRTRKAILTAITITMVVCLILVSFIAVVMCAGCGSNSGSGDYSQDELMDKAIDIQKQVPPEDNPDFYE